MGGNYKENGKEMNEFVAFVTIINAVLLFLSFVLLSHTSQINKLIGDSLKTFGELFEEMKELHDSIKEIEPEEEAPPY